MIIPDWTILASAFIFLFTLWALNRFLFRPLFKILDVRNAKTVESKDEAQRIQEQRNAIFQNYSNRIKGEKQQGYQKAEKARKDALIERQKLINEARQKSDAVLTKAKEEIEGEVQAVKQTLQRDAEEMAGIIAAQVLEKT